MTPIDSADADSGALAAHAARLVRHPGYFLALAAGLGLVAIPAASGGSEGLAVFAGVHMLLALAAAGWRAGEMGLVSTERRAPALPAGRPTSVTEAATEAGSSGA